MFKFGFTYFLPYQLRWRDDHNPLSSNPDAIVGKNGHVKLDEFALLIGDQLAEQAQLAFPSKVQPLSLGPQEKERLAYALHAAFTDNTLRISDDEKLRADLRAMRKEVTAAGHVRLDGQADDSHCDRFWAKALRQEAARHQNQVGAEVGW